MNRLNRTKQFWFGFLTSTLLAIGIALGLWRVVVWSYVSWISIILGFTASTLVWVTIYAKLRPAKSELSDSSGKSWLMVANAALMRSLGSHLGFSESESNELFANAKRRGENFLIWIFYWKLLKVLVAIILILISTVGTFLLIEQNRKLQEHSVQLRLQTTEMTAQNQLESLSLTKRVRDEFSSDSLSTNSLRRLTFSEPESCPFSSLFQGELSAMPNKSSVKAIASIAESNPIWQTKLIETLHFLLEDSDSSVRIGALQTLDILGKLNRERIVISRAYVDSFDIASTVLLIFKDSVVGAIRCPRCSIRLDRSALLHIPEVIRVTGKNSVVEIPSIYWPEATKLGDNRTSFLSKYGLMDSLFLTKLFVDPNPTQGDLSNHRAPAAKALKEIGRNNYVSFVAPDDAQAYQNSTFFGSIRHRDGRYQVRACSKL